MKINKIFFIIIVAFIYRFVLLLIDTYWIRLPQGGADTENFDQWAYNIHIYDSFTFLEKISNGTVLFSSYGAFIYDIFGRKPFIWAFSLLLLGVGTVYNIYKTTLIVTKNQEAANLAGWLICFYPNIAILSVLLLREAPIHFFVSIAALSIVKYYDSKKRRNLILFFIASLICTMFHSGMFAIFIGFLIATFFYNDKISFSNKLIIIIITLAGLFFINYTGLGLSKFGGSFLGAINKLEEGLYFKETSGAIYPSWLIMNGGSLDLWKIPLRIIAFLFAPFLPFLVKSLSHLLGVVDGLFYFLLILKIYRKKNILKKNKIISMIISIIMMLTFAFSLGSSNFGTNIRHRAKILPLIVIVGAAAYRIQHNKI